MPKVEAKKHIEKLYRLRTNDAYNAITLANALEKDIRTGFLGGHKFVFELLQNANDATRADEKNTVSFVYTGQYLVVRHAGKHFSKTDVEKISDYAQQEYNDKANDQEKIGYKGIGFKAVFSISDCVYIISGDYSFKFDRHHAQWKNLFGEKCAPWPVTPIWCEGNNIPDEVKRNIQHNYVNFIIKLNNPDEIVKDLEFLVNNSQILLFLHNIKTVEVYVNRLDTLTKIENENNIVTMQQNKKIISQWKTRNVIMKIPERTKEYLQTLDDYICPARLKRSTHTRITFSARIRKDTLDKVTSSSLFCYLPTQVDIHLPYLVNADFLLNPERTHLQDNKWNYFLLKYIAYFQFKWLGELAREKWAENYILKLLSQGYFDSMQVKLHNAFQEGFDLGRQRFELIPSIRQGQKEIKLLKINECYVDKTGFFKEFYDQEMSEKIASYNLEEIEKLEKFGANVFRIQNSCNKISKMLSKNPLLKNAILFTQYLKKQSEKNKNWFYYLKKTKFLISNEDSIEEPITLHFMPHQFPDLSIDLNIKFVHPALFKNIAGLKLWLEKLGVSYPDYGNIIKEYIKANLSQKDKKGLLEIARLLFFGFNNDYLRKKDLIEFRELKLLTTQGNLKAANQCYLSNWYRPSLKLERIFPEIDMYVSLKYVENEHEKSVWRGLLKLLGVKSKVQIHYYDMAQQRNQLKSEWGVSIDDYCDYLHDTERVPKKNSPYAIRFMLQNFVTVDLLEHTRNSTIAGLVFKTLMEEFDEIKSFSENAKYHNRASKLSYLQYYFRYKKQLTDTQGQVNTSLNLLMPSFREKLGNILSVANINANVTKEQAEFFGFRSQLNLDECLTLLEHIETNNTPDLEIYAIVFEQLLSINLSEQEREKLINWDGKLLAQDNSLQKKLTLKYLVSEHDKAPCDQYWLKNIPGLTNIQMKEICKLFHIDLVRANIVYHYTDSVEDSSFRKQFFKILPAISLIEANEKVENPEKTYKKLARSFLTLTIYQVNQLVLRSEEGILIKKCRACIHNNLLLLKDRWNHLSTKDELLSELSSFLDLGERAAMAFHSIINVQENSTEFQEWLCDRGFNKKQCDQLKHIKLSDEELEDETVRETMQLLKVSGISDSDERVSEEDSESDSNNTSHESSDVSDSSDEKAMVLKKNPTLLTSKETKEQSPSTIETVFIEEFDPIKFEKTNRFPITPSKLAPVVKKNMTSSSSGSSDTVKTKVKSMKQTLSYDQTVPYDNTREIGRWGEHAVYIKLKNHYEKKYNHAILKETKEGFELRDNHFCLTLIWHNKNGESGQSVDFEIIKENNNKKTHRYVEVKSTRSNKSEIMTITHNEWHLMKEKREHYRFFRVYNAGNYQASRVEKIKDPYGKLKADHLNIKKVEIKL